MDTLQKKVGYGNVRSKTRRELTTIEHECGLDNVRDLYWKAITIYCMGQSTRDRLPSPDFVQNLIPLAETTQPFFERITSLIKKCCHVVYSISPHPDTKDEKNEQIVSAGASGDTTTNTNELQELPHKLELMKKELISKQNHVGKNVVFNNDATLVSNSSEDTSKTIHLAGMTQQTTVVGL